MPPIARLSPEQALYHFISGYTSKLAGTEMGLGIEPGITLAARFIENFKLFAGECPPGVAEAEPKRLKS